MADRSQRAGFFSFEIPDPDHESPVLFRSFDPSRRKSAVCAESGT